MMKECDTSLNLHFLRFHLKIITKWIHRDVLRRKKSKRYSYESAYELITKITKTVCIIKLYLCCVGKLKRLNNTDYQNGSLTSQSSTQTAEAPSEAPHTPQSPGATSHQHLAHCGVAQDLAQI